MRQVTFNCKCYPFVVFPTFVSETAAKQSPQQPSPVQGRVKRWKCRRENESVKCGASSKTLCQCPCLIWLFFLLAARRSRASAHRLSMLLVSSQEWTSTSSPPGFSPQISLLTPVSLLFAVQSCKIFVTKEMLLLSISIGYTGGWKRHQQKSLQLCTK